MRSSILSSLCLDARVALLAAAVAAPFAPAQAQLGKLVKRGVQGAIEGAVDKKAREAVGAPAEGSATSSASTSSASTSSASTSKAASKLEITPAHLDAFLVAMAEPVAVARENVAARAALVEQRRKYEAQDACHINVIGRGPASSYTPAQQARIDALTARQGPLTDRLTASAERLAANPADAALRRQADALSDSAKTLAAQLTEAFYPTLTKECGARLPEPPAKVEDRKIPGARLPAGMTGRQFGLMRERVGAWLLNNGIAAGLSDTERAALESKRAQLAPLADILRREIHWVSWSDDEFRS
jgi:hypothetical protein